MALQEPTAPVASKSAASILRIRDWRMTLVAALIGLLIAMAMLMKWVVEFQVEAARERRLSESVAREAAARCHEKAPPQAVSACLKELAAGAVPVNR